MGSFALCKEGNVPKLMLYTNFSMCEIIYCILRRTAAVGAVVQRPLCGLSSGRN